jgi:hypothetical protein
MRFTDVRRRARGAAALLAALGAVAAHADTASLHTAIQGRWRADNRQVAEQVPGWKEMTAAQREKVLAVIPPLDFEITAAKIVWKAASPGDQDEPLTYKVVGAQDRTLKLSGTNADGEKKDFTIEVLGPDALKLSSPEAPSLRLERVVSASPSPAPSPSPKT